MNEPWRLSIPLIIFRFTRYEKNNIFAVISDLQGTKILGILNWKENWVSQLLLSKISYGGNSLQIEWNIKITPQTIRPRPQVSGYFWKNFHVHTCPYLNSNFFFVFGFILVPRTPLGILRTEHASLSERNLHLALPCVQEAVSRKSRKSNIEIEI